MKFQTALFAAVSALALTNAAVFAQNPISADAFASDAEAAALAHDSIIDGLAGRTWLFTSDSGFDEALVKRAKARGIELMTIPTRAASRESVENFLAAAKALGSPRLEAASYMRPEQFIMSWLVERPDEATAKLAFLADNATPVVAGFAVIPSGGAYIACQSNELTAATLKKYFARFRGMHENAGETLMFRHLSGGATGGAGGASMSIAEAYLRRSISISGNNLGALFYDVGLKDDAFSAFMLAHSIDTNNISPVLNMASIVREGVKPERGPGIIAQLKAWAEANVQSWTLTQTSGVVLKPEEFLPIGWWWVASGIGFTDRAKLESFINGVTDPNVSAMLEQQAASRISPAAAVAQTKGWLESPEFQAAPAGGYLLDCARRHFVASDTERALVTLARAEAVGGADSEQIARVKAGILTASGDSAAAITALEASKTADNAPEILEIIAATHYASGDTSAFLKAIRELAALKDAPVWVADFAAAIEASAKGDADAALASVNKAVEKGAEKVFTISYALNLAWEARNLGDADRYAVMVLRVNPRDFLANYVHASALMQARKLDEAERFYLAAVSANPNNWMALNDLAALLTEKGKNDVAMKLIEQSLKVGGDISAAVWDTYGTLLRKAGKLKEANKAFRTAATKPDAEDPRVQLNVAEAALDDGDKDAARKALAIVDKDKDSLSIEERERLGKVRSKLR